MQVNRMVWPVRPGVLGHRLARSRRVPPGPTALIPSVLVLLLSAVTVSAQTVPSGFTESGVIAGLTEPTAVRFSPDGRVFVAEKSGLIKVFDDLSDSTPTVFADLRTKVHNFWDRGLLGLALHPGFPTAPWVYVLYTHDAAIGGTAPRWGDMCPSPPGATEDGCVVSARLSRLQASGNVMTGSEQVLLEGWGQQYPSHSIGALAFGADGALYVSSGDGASFTFVDYGQDGSPLNPLGDPPVPVGSLQTPPSAEGGALRSQSPRRPAGEPVVLNGAILRVDPETGAPLPENPLFSHPDPMARRIVGYGLRNPFRIITRPGTSEIWIADVGWADWEELNRISAPTTFPVTNFGWPCYEGPGRQPGYDAANLTLCEQLYGTPTAVTAPYYTYHHAERVVPGESCPTGSSAITGLAFYGGGSYPPAYTGALFFADHSRRCIWAMFPGASGLPDPATRSTFVASARNPVDLQIGPGGDLFYVDLTGGTIRRVTYASGNQPPTAVIQAVPLFGPVPLTVGFSGTASSDPDAGQALTYSWDLNGDGVFGDSTAAEPSFTYATAGNYTVRLRVTDPLGASHTATVVIAAGNSPPAAVINSPLSTLAWGVGDSISFAGHAVDAEQGTLPASALSWSLLLHHCPSNCHVHPLQTFSGVASGSFTAPDHEYPSHLELVLTATDAGGLQHTTSVILQPLTVQLSFASSPPGLQLAVGAASTATPFVVDVIQGSNNSISAPSPQALSGTNYQFSAWSDGGAATHNITAASAMTLTATYTPAGPASTEVGLVAAYSFDSAEGVSVTDVTGNGHTAVLLGGAAWSPAGKHGGAVLCDGVNDLVEISDSALLHPTTALTAMAWVYPVTSQSGFRAVLVKEQISSPAEATWDVLHSTLPANQPGVEVVFGTTGKVAIGGGVLPVGQWSHLALTYDNTTLWLYINGVPTVGTPATGSMAATGMPLHMCGSTVYPGEYANIRLDDVRIYNRALSPAEVQSAMNTPVGSPPPPNQPPTAVAQASPLSGPAPLTVTFDGTGSSDPDPGDTLTYAWDLDGDGQFDDAAVPGPTASYSAPGTYTARLRVTDSRGASSQSAPITITVTGGEAPGPVAAYHFDQGSGTSVADASGNGHTGTLLNGAAFTTAGKNGGAVTCDGVNDLVEIADSALLHPTTALTVMAWVYPITAQTGYKAVIIKEQSASPAAATWDILHVTGPSNQPGVEVVLGTTGRVAKGGSVLPVGQWTHLALTWDNTTLRLYVNGALTASTPATGSMTATGLPLHMCGSSVYAGEHANIRIDDVRIYNRVLTTTDVQSDMNTPVGSSSPPPNQPPSAVAQGSPLSGPAPLTVTFDGSGSSDPDPGDTLSYAWDLDGDGQFDDSTAINPTATFSSPGTYSVTLRVTDSQSAAAVSPSVVIGVTAPPAPPGQVAAYSFDQGSGTSVPDASGNGHTGTISGATWTSAGKYGGALSFDGVNDWVTIADSDALDLTTGMTLAAWVFPAAHTTFRTVVMKERPGHEVYSLYSNTSGGRPAGGIVRTSNVKLVDIAGSQPLPLNSWTHLAVTYDSTTLRLYVNGAQVASKSAPGVILTSGSPLRIGGNSVWSEFFQGRIDEVRIFNRALTATELQSVMSTPLP
jgi:PKD repeat protein